MLIGFRVSNFRSIKDEATLSMVAANGEELPYNFTKPAPKHFKHNVLKSAALYGPNASGKTNILKALDLMQDWVLLSDKNDWEDNKEKYQPYKFSNASRQSNSSFDISFIVNENYYNYRFSISKDRVEEEILTEYENARGRTLFSRQFDKDKNDYVWTLSDSLKGSKSLWRKSTRPQSLFLSIAKGLNSERLSPLYDWFRYKLKIFTNITTAPLSKTIEMLENNDKKQKLIDFMQVADFDIIDATIETKEFFGTPLPTPFGLFLRESNGEIDIKDNKIVAHKITFAHKSDNPEYSSLVFDEESKGTQSYFRLAGNILDALDNGKVVFIDEIESSLHPHLIEHLIGYFHSETTNSHGAQLVFTTHNTSLLNKNLFRRDQIWLVEKDRDNGSRFFCVNDFKPRKDEALEKNYLSGRYGALPLIYAHE